MNTRMVFFGHIYVYQNVNYYCCSVILNDKYGLLSAIFHRSRNDSHKVGYFNGYLATSIIGLTERRTEVEMASLEEKNYFSMKIVHCVRWLQIVVEKSLRIELRTLQI